MKSTFIFNNMIWTSRPGKGLHMELPASTDSIPSAHPGKQPGQTLATQPHKAMLPPVELLAAQSSGRLCVLVGLSAGGRLGQRLADMGFAPGLPLSVVRRAPLGDPMEVDLAGARVCIRTSEAAVVLVRPLPVAAKDRP
jgi:Fe2+ transport system protein FeoA